MDLILKKINKLLLENGIEERERKAFIQQLQTELKGKKYGLVWENKVEKVSERLKTHIPYLTEVEEKCLLGSPDDDTHHLLIEGDNLEALTLLQTTHKNKIDICYIDPPYNTGNKDFVYNDHIIDKDDTYRHSKWLSFMEKRLKLAYDLLANDGVIFISIDDHEIAQLKLLCDKIFGEDNFISNLIWINNLKGRQIDKHLANVNEYILCYAKKMENLRFNKFKESSDEVIEKYSLSDEFSNYKKGVVLYNTNSKFNIETRKNLVYTIYFNPETGQCICKDEKYLENGKWVLPEENFLGDPYIKITPPIRSTNNKRGCWRWSKEKFESEYQREIMIVKDNKGKYMAYTKDRLTNDGVKLTKYKNLISNISSTTGTTELTNILKDKLFDYPKPKELLKIILEMSSKPQSIILDFFAGSGTTGHAVLELNQQDGGSRQFILCTNNENNICEEVTYERLSRVINGYMDSKGKFVKGIAANMDYYKVNTIPKVNNSIDNAVKYLTKGIEIIGIKENAFNREDFKGYSILSNRDKVVLVYLEPFVLGHEVIEISKKLKGYGQSQKIIYSTMTDVTVQGIEVKEYPQEILEQINRIQEILKQWEDETVE